MTLAILPGLLLVYLSSRVVSEGPGDPAHSLHHLLLDSSQDRVGRNRGMVHPSAPLAAVVGDLGLGVLSYVDGLESSGDRT